jgi:hypothetical protein
VLVHQPFDMKLFLEKRVDAAAAMTYNEYKQVLDAGVTPEELVVIDFNEEGRPCWRTACSSACVGPLVRYGKGSAHRSS